MRPHVWNGVSVFIVKKSHGIWAKRECEMAVNILAAFPGGVSTLYTCIYLFYMGVKKQGT
jgi:hypothetical protein